MRFITKLAVCAGLALLFTPVDTSFANDYGQAAFSAKCKANGGVIFIVKGTTEICHYAIGGGEECHFAKVGWCSDLAFVPPPVPTSTGAHRRG